MSLAALAVGLWLGGGGLAFCVWTVRLWAHTELKPGADYTTLLLWHAGRVLIWLGAGGVATVVFASGAWLVARALGGLR